jgi:hypothetical protein
MLWLSMETVSAHVAKMSSEDTFSTGLNSGMCTEQRYYRKLFCVKIGPWSLTTSRAQEQQSAAMTLRSLRSSIRYSFSGGSRMQAGKSLESSNYQVKDCSCPPARSRCKSKSTSGRQAPEQSEAMTTQEVIGKASKFAKMYQARQSNTRGDGTSQESPELDTKFDTNLA